MLKINFQNFHFNDDGSARDYAAEKIGHLEKYYKNIVLADLYLTSTPGDTANVRYTFKTNLEIPGEVLFAEESDADIHVAIDRVEQKLKQQLAKQKEKQANKKLYRAKEAIRRFFG